MNTDGEANPVSHHRNDGHRPILSEAIGKIGYGQHADAQEVNLFRADPINEPAGKRADKPGNRHADAVHEAKLCRRRAQRNDVNGQIRKDHLVGQPVQRGPHHCDFPIALLPPDKGNPHSSLLLQKGALCQSKAGLIPRGLPRYLAFRL